MTRPGAADQATLRVLFFGTATTEPGYPRPRVLLRGLREAGVAIEDCRQPLWAHSGERVDAARSLFSPRSLLHLLRTEVGLARRLLAAGEHDVVLVGPEGHLDILLLRLLGGFRRRPVVFDPFISLHDTVVEDRQLIPPHSLRAHLLRALDRLACRFADAVILDTDAMLRHYVDDLHVPAHKLFRVLVGEEEDLFSPPGGAPLPEPPTDPFRVIWFGTHIPLHGVSVIVDAAAALRTEGIEFTLVGSGQELARSMDRAQGLSNIVFVPSFIAPVELRQRIYQSHVALGIFGTTRKASRVIPCKVFDILSAGRPLVTADTPAIRELVTPDQHAVLVPPGNPAALAEALLALRRDTTKRQALAHAGRRLYREKATPAVLGIELLSILRRVVPTP